MIRRFKKGDAVEVISGRDKGKSGKITQVFRQEDMVVVDGINIRFKHIRARRRGEVGQRVQFAAPLAAAKVQLVCPHCSKRTRVSIEMRNDKRVRFCKKCKQAI
ncbi:MAG: 50S ribosomal protein L24 [Patescibacteria group bacterium]